MTWSDFIAYVTARITDTTPTEATFTEAQAQYVRARMVIELLKPQDATAVYAIQQNKYTSLRRKLAGFQTAQTASQQQTAVRSLIASSQATDALFERTVALFLKGNIARDLNDDAELAVQMLGEYRELKVGMLLGYQYSGSSSTLETNVTALLISSTTSPNSSTYINANILQALADLNGMAQWFNSQVAAAAADLQSLHDRVIKEIRAAVITLQDLIPAYRIGQVSTFNEVNTSQMGKARTGVLPAQAQVQEARIIEMPDAGAVSSIVPVFQSMNPAGALARLLVDAKSRPLDMVMWTDRHHAMIERDTAQRMVAISPDAAYFMLPAALVRGRNVLELAWNGLKLDFLDADTVPFDEGAAACCAFFVQKELALEFGDPVKTVEQYAAAHRIKQTKLYLEMRDRVQVAGMPMRSAGGWPHGGRWNRRRAANPDYNGGGDCNTGGFGDGPGHGRHDEPSVWLQLLDSGTLAWRGCWLSNGVFVDGSTAPQVEHTDWPVISGEHHAQHLGVRTNGGFVQLFDIVSLAWRSIWWNNGALAVGAPDVTAADGQPATAFRLYVTGQTSALQLVDQANPTQFRTMLLRNGVLSAGSLTS